MTPQEQDERMKEIDERIKKDSNAVIESWAKDDIPFLLSEVKRLKAELEDARKANYADDFNFQHEKAKRLEAENAELKKLAHANQPKGFMLAYEALQKETEALRARNVEFERDAVELREQVKMYIAIDKGRVAALEKQDEIIRVDKGD